ncbi:MAG: fused MFS/spermidine synthase [Acidobacteria bacterium]|nr:fused MFS/spermidine synthase [Acidobacteriota bacterium]
MFFLSGALGLGYQVLWSKLLLLFVGVSSHSYALVLAAFMTGLALGSRFLGPLADRVRSPLALFGWLELGVGAYAVAYPALAGWAGELYLAWARSSGLAPTSPGLLALKAATAMALLVPPTFLMGGTYPALVRLDAASLRLVGRSASLLYASNAAGAVTGSLAMAMLLIPVLGLNASLMALAVGNAAVGLVALLAAGRAGTVRAAASREAEPRLRPAGAGVRLGLLVAFLAGFISFTFEVGFTRAFSVVMGGSTQSFAAILAAFVAGIAAGSALLARFESRIPDPLRFFGALQIATGLLVLLPLPLYPLLPWGIGRIAQELPPTDLGYQAWGLLKLATCLLFILLPALCMGVSIPILVKALLASASSVGRETGRIYAANTLGNVSGALATGLFLLPWLGTQRLLEVAAIASAASGIVAILGDPKGTPKQSHGTALRRAVVAALAVAALGAFLPRWNQAWFSLAVFRRTPIGTFGETRAAIARREVVFHRDDPAAHVLVLRSRGTEDALSLLVNGKPDASAPGDQPTQLLLGHLPLLLAPEARDVLVIGLASGVTSGAVLRHPVRRLDVVDIVRTMPAAAAHFDAWSGDPLSDPRARFIADDARSYLLSTPRKYDVIVSEPSNPWTAGTGSLFATEFYRSARERLREDGIYVQWLQAYELSDPLLAATLRSFRSAFANVTLWETASLDVVLVGSRASRAPDVSALGARLASFGVREQLAPLGLLEPRDVLLLQRFSPPTVDWIAAGAPIDNSDDNLLLEYRAPRDLFCLARPRAPGAYDERQVASPSLAVAPLLRGDSEAVLSGARLYAGRVFGSAQLLSDWLTAVARGTGRAYRDLPADLRAALPEGAPEREPESDLLARLRGAVSRGDAAAADRLLLTERGSLATTALVSAAGAARLDAELESISGIAKGRTAALVGLTRVDVLSAAGRAVDAEAVLEDLLASGFPLAVEEVLLRGCRLDPEAGCTRLAQRLHGASPDERLERFLELRLSPSSAPSKGHPSEGSLPEAPPPPSPSR